MRESSHTHVYTPTCAHAHTHTKPAHQWMGPEGQSSPLMTKPYLDASAPCTDPLIFPSLPYLQGLEGSVHLFSQPSYGICRGRGGGG